MPTNAITDFDRGASAIARRRPVPTPPAYGRTVTCFFGEVNPAHCPPFAFQDRIRET